MNCRLAITSLAILSMIGLARPVCAAQPNNPSFDPFAFEGTQNILDEAHFGIVNGKLTCGIPYRDMFAVRGLWAPPYVSSDFHLDITVMGQPVAADLYTWHPFYVERSGSIQAVAVETVTMLIPGSRAGLLEMTLKNTTAQERTVPVAIRIGGTLDKVTSARKDYRSGWKFDRPHSGTATTRKATDGSLVLSQGDLAIVLRAPSSIRWDDSQPAGEGSVPLSPSGQTKLYIVFAIGRTAEAKAACDKIAADPERAIADTYAAYAQRVRDLYEKLPVLKSNNPTLVRFYNKSLVHLLMNRWDVPEFVLHPYYSTGSVNGGCVCEYLYNFGENWEIFPLYDPEATRSHIKLFLASDMTEHFAFEPTTGVAWGPWYMVNQEKIIGLIYYYVKNTGDTAFLNDTVDGKTVLQHAILNAMHLDDPTKPVTLIDYGPSNSHLELRRGIPYNHVMPDLNGRRYNNYIFAAELADLAGKPEPMLRRRAEELRTVLKSRLWNKDTRWFDFEDGKGKKDTRYTVQMFKLFGSKVLDAEQEAGLLEHLNSEKEFLSEIGLHGMAKGDLAYDSNDVDNGGPGSCTCFAPQIAERLYKAGHAAAAENILKRILWWGERTPYWGDSFRADKIGYNNASPLACTIDGATVAQCVIFGMFGVRAEPNGDIRINPQPPAFASQIKLKGLRLRGHVLDIEIDGGKYEVREKDNRVDAPLGQSILVRGDQLGDDIFAEIAVELYQRERISLKQSVGGTL